MVQQGGMPRAANELYPVAAALVPILDGALITFAFSSDQGPEGSASDGSRAVHAAATAYRDKLRRLERADQPRVGVCLYTSGSDTLRPPRCGRSRLLHTAGR